MSKYRTIVVGYDGTSFSDAALSEAIEMAKGSNGRIILITSAEINYEVDAISREFTDELTDQAQLNLDKAAAQVENAGLEYETVLSSADAHEAIVDTAAEKGADLIVLGTHGRKGLMRLLMGSTTERVIGHAPCAVLVVRSADRI